MLFCFRVDLFNGQVAKTPDVIQTLVSSIRENISETTSNLQNTVRYLATLENDKFKNFHLWLVLWWWSVSSSGIKYLTDYPLACIIIHYHNLVTDQESISNIKWPVLGIYGEQDHQISDKNV